MVALRVAPAALKRLLLSLVSLCPLLSAAVAQADELELLEILSGTAILGDPHGEANEQSASAHIRAFAMMRTEVTNAQFAAFVAATGHLTDAERDGRGWVWTDAWRQVDGANWRHPHGPRSTIDQRSSHPVVQVSVRDARAFCAHHGLRLPSEAQWQYAARGDGDARRYPWGNSAPRQDSLPHRANFGTLACCAAHDGDGYTNTAPVGSYPSGRSPFGLDDMAGNVWEWTASAPTAQPGWAILKGGGWGNNPFCLRVAYKHTNPNDIGLDMVGFRCAKASPACNPEARNTDIGTCAP